MTAADLGRPIAAIVQRCGPPGSVMTLGTVNQLLYGDGGRGTVIYFDADQMRARILQFFTFPPEPSQPIPDWTVALPFQSGERAIDLGNTTLSEAQDTLAADADVTTKNGAAFRSTPQNDVVLACSFDDRMVRAAFVGERASLVQNGMIASPLGEAPLDYMSPLPRDAWLRDETMGKAESTGPQSTIFRVDVDAAGIVRKVVIVVPSADASFDASMQAKIGDVRFHPATLEHRPVSGSCFVQVRH